MTKYLLSLTLLFLLATSYSQTHSYQFAGNFNEVAAGPALTEVLSCGATTGSYTSQSINTASGTCSGGPQQVFNFNEGGGFSYPNASFIGGTYTINIFFKFNSLSNFQRIIDFKNSTSDAGMYINDDCLFIVSANFGTCRVIIASYKRSTVNIYIK